jgi:ABC-type Fe3+ transport system permease subunit
MRSTATWPRLQKRGHGSHPNCTHRRKISPRFHKRSYRIQPACIARTQSHADESSAPHFRRTPMSIVESTLLSLARATAVSLATLALLLIAGPGVGSASRPVRRFVFWIATAALLAPGFASAFMFLKLAPDAGSGREFRYGLFVWSRCALLPLLVIWLMPPSVSPEAMHCFRQSTASWWRRRLWELRAWGRGLWVGIALVFFFAFQEFEIATTWNMRAWTVSLFDAQTGGLALRESLRLALLPLILQAALIAMLAKGFHRDETPAEFRGPFTGRASAALAPAMLSVVFCCAPMFFALVLTTQWAWRHGFKAFDIAPWREISNSLILSAAATLCAWLIAGWIACRRGWRLVLMLPGLLGPLLSGLLLLALVQASPLHLLRDTAFPAVLGLALILLPYALLLRFGIEATCDRGALHIARSSDARRAVWHLDGWPRLCAVLMLFCFGYGDFTINTLLAPPQFTSVSARLLNLLHYGRSDALMMMFILAFAVPLSVALLTALAARFYPHRRAS